MKTNDSFRSTTAAVAATAALMLGACGGGSGDAPTTGAITTPVMSLLAGDDGGPGSLDGRGAAARFDHPFGIAVATNGDVFVADSYNHVIRRVTPDGDTTTFAGRAGQAGSSDGARQDARFSYPRGLAFDAAGNLFVADSGNSTIRRIAADGSVGSVAGLAGSAGSDNGAGAAARFRTPYGLAFDGAGNLLVADLGNANVRRIAANAEVTTVAGLAGQPGGTDGPAATARFRQPAAVAYGNGVIYVADYQAHTVRAIDAGGNVTTLIGADQVSGATDGPLANARLSGPIGLAWTGGAAPALLVTAGLGQTLKVADLRNGTVSTVAGAAQALVPIDGPIAQARFVSPRGVAVAASGVIYLADGDYASSLRRIEASSVSTLAGRAARLGSDDGRGAAAGFNRPEGLAVFPNGDLAVADNLNGMLRRVTVAGEVSTLSGVARQYGYVDGPSSIARWRGLAGVAVDRDGSLLVADGRSAVRRVDAAGVVTTVAGNGAQDGSIDGPALDARFRMPYGLALAGDGSLAIADASNGTIRRLAAGQVSTVAGLAGSWSNTDGAGSAARFDVPTDCVYDRAGNLWVVDAWTHTIRRVTPAGEVQTIAGSAYAPGSTDGSGANARFNSPTHLAIDGEDNVYVSDTGNGLIRRITPAGAVTTVVGVAGETGIRLGSAPRLYQPRGLSVLPGRRLGVAMAAGVFIVQLP